MIYETWHNNVPGFWMNKHDINRRYVPNVEDSVTVERDSIIANMNWAAGR